ncbi:hypothetical protein, partial [Klebsiella pneumoniae]|uniref:hypothetical protein n=1 Tax=Klebsiella pneumoniae TaxID=573 RepID=UPI001E3DFDFE
VLQAWARRSPSKRIGRTKLVFWAKQDPNTTIQSTDNTKFRVAEGNGLIAVRLMARFELAGSVPDTEGDKGCRC